MPRAFNSSWKRTAKSRHQSRSQPGCGLRRMGTLPARMRPAINQPDWRWRPSRPSQAIVRRVSIDLQHALIAGHLRLDLPYDSDFASTHRPLPAVRVAKFDDHIPLYRLSEMYDRIGVDISRSVMADWVGRVGEPSSTAVSGDLRPSKRPPLEGRRSTVNALAHERLPLTST